jgi:hypothetical protein
MLGLLALGDEMKGGKQSIYWLHGGAKSGMLMAM